MIIPPGYAHVQHFFGGPGLPNGAAVTYGVSGFLSGGLSGAAVALHLAFADAWENGICNSVHLEETRVKQGPNATGPFYAHQEVIPMAVTGSQLPPNVALLVEKRTELGGRSGRGRFYIPGLPESDVDAAGVIVPANVVGFQAAADAFLAAVEGIATGMFLLHSASSDPTRVTDLTIDPVAATQRRRLR